MDVKALEKHPCPACGGQSVWNPTKQMLVCPFCGTSTPQTSSGQRKLNSGESNEVILEHDLVTALRNIPDEKRGWQVERISVRCQHCDAVSVFDVGRVGQRCDFCGSAQLVPYEATRAPFRPESILPLKFAENDVRDKVKSWLKGVWFAPNNLSKISNTDQLKAIYLPFWTFDAFASAEWEADAGYYYYTTENFTDSNGKQCTRQVQHIRWESAHGDLTHTFDDILIPASKGVDPILINELSPFPTSLLVPYDPAYLAGWTVEQYQIDLVEAAQQSRARMEEKVRQMCADEVPGNTYRNLTFNSSYSDQTFKHILAPTWLVTYNYGTKTYQVAVNGVTGKVAGRYPKSWIKILFALLFAIVIIGIIAYFGELNQR